MSAASRLRAGLRSIAVDTTPLRASRDFRLLWIGRSVSNIGNQMTQVALFFQVFELAGSAAALGLLGLVQLVPLGVATVLAGPIIDAVDRRKLLIVTEFFRAGASALLLAGALTGDPPLWLVYGAAALASGLAGIDNPTRSAMTPTLVGRQLLPAAFALGQVMWNTTTIIGPAIGGAVIGKLGLAWAYGIDTASFGTSIVATFLIKPMPPQSRSEVTGLAAIKEGFAYLRRSRLLLSTFAVDLIAMILGMPRALFPVLALTQFGGGPGVVGLLFAAPGVGALLGAVTTGWVGRVRAQGKAVLIAVALWGVGIAAFGLSGNLLLALVFLAFAGAADVISAVFRSTILQLSVPDSLRGRVSAIHILVVTGGPRLGDFEAGMVAQAFGPVFSVVSGGIGCIVGVALMALFVPEFRRYRREDHAQGP